MKIAVVHDWLITYGGAERTLEQILKVYPEADLFALYDFVPENARGFIQNKRVTTSFLQHFPFARTKYRSYLPLMPLAVEQLDLSGYDVVISSSYACAKGVITGPDQLHISYVYSPIRYAWDMMHQYLRQSDLEHGPKSWFVRYVLH
ncbi:MAG TPA: glycosyltransferase family 4 protein, partial [candidate division Zixibacteria bacterium]|nr:glycosyltransferase family 4 protein [candidate division Zixibacteria bacterium]